MIGWFWWVRFTSLTSLNGVQYCRAAGQGFLHNIIIILINENAELFNTAHQFWERHSRTAGSPPEKAGV